MRTGLKPKRLSASIYKGLAEGVLQGGFKIMIEINYTGVSSFFIRPPRSNQLCFQIGFKMGKIK